MRHDAPGARRGTGLNIKLQPREVRKSEDLDAAFTSIVTRDPATYHGWFIGGGDEYAFNWLPGLFWKNEYRLLQFDKQVVAVRFADGTGAYRVE